MSSTRPLPPLFRAVVDPLQRFFHLEAASGILLMLAAVTAMLWANSPFSDTYHHLLETPLAVSVAGWTGAFSLHHLISDGLMAFFFLLVGLEIKRELVVGELNTLSKAMLPLIAAAGGMVVPAGIYLFFNPSGKEATGWAIPMATDIAFSIGVLTLLKGRITPALVVFLTALAIFDDLGGILVIALFYGTGLHLNWLLGAAAITVLIFLGARFGLRNTWLFWLAGLGLWLTMHYGGIHATIAGVVLGMLVPARSARHPREVLRGLHAHSATLLDQPEDEDLQNEQILQIEDQLEDLEPPLNRLIHGLHAPVAFVIVPLFALANSGVDVRQMSLATLLEPLPLGIALGLFLGKQVGIFAFAWAAIRLKVSPLPGGARWAQLHGVAVVGGIGFTVALFVAGLAFADAPALLEKAKLGILVGSFVAAVVGYLMLRVIKPRAVG